MTSWWCESAWLDGAPTAGVRVTAQAGVVSSVQTGVAPSPADSRLPGLVLPGFADTHSHAFHRALRGRTHAGAGDFWTWRRAMYDLAARLDPDSLLSLARAAFAELALGGVTTVGEFHYLRLGNATAADEAIRQAARDSGVRLTLIDAAYLRGGLDADGREVDLDDAQRRFADADVDAWAARVTARTPDPLCRLGVAAHSVRAVPREALPVVVAAAGDGPLHAHVAEQAGEVAACRAAYGTSPVHVLADAGALGPATTAVHATHVDTADVALLARAGAAVCLCPTTERDLADGIAPARALADAGVRLCVGSDQHTVADLLEEARGVEMHERLARGRRGAFSPPALVRMLTADGHAALGWPEAGRIGVGAPCDLVALRLDSVRTAGIDSAQVVMAATAVDVDTVVMAGRTVVQGGRHVLGDVAALLRNAIEPLWST